MKKIKEFLAKHNNKESKIAVAAVAATGAATVSAHAGAGEIVNNLLGYIFGIFFWIGVVLLAWGVGQLVLAFKNEDGDSKSRAIMLIMASIVLMAVGGIFGGLGISGVTVNSPNTNF